MATYRPAWHLEGMAQLEKQLVLLGEAFGYKGIARKPILKTTLELAIDPVLQDIRRNVPVEQGKRYVTFPRPLKDTINVNVRKPRRADLASPQVSPNTFLIASVGIPYSKKLKAQELGTASLPAKHFIRVSMERNISAVQERLIANLKGAIDLIERSAFNKIYKGKR